MRKILEASVRPEAQIKIATALEQFGRKYREELSQIGFDNLRDKSEIEPAILE
jgi:hypothetical protein